MKNIFIKEATRTTPYACVNYQSGVIKLGGRSSPENTMEFYEPFLKAISLMSKMSKPEITAKFKMMYFNTSSARCIYLIIKELKKLQDRGKKVKVVWFAEEDDEDMLETGMDFQDILGIAINIQMIKNAEA